MSNIYGRKIFVDLQKAFETVNILLIIKLDHYGIHDVVNKWF